MAPWLYARTGIVSKISLICFPYARGRLSLLIWHENLRIAVPKTSRLAKPRTGTLNQYARLANLNVMIDPTFSTDRRAPLRLRVAAKIAFPDGSMSASGLRNEAKRGRLMVERIAGRDYTTLENIDRMRELCRVPARAPDSTSERPDTGMESSLPKPYGLSKMEIAISPQAALQARLARNLQSKQSKR